jgi:D-proline reductase (dithiol) PrdB
VTLLSSAGIVLKTDVPFDQEGERQNPWWGDPSYRILPKTATQEEVRLYHMHIDPAYAEQDLNCLFPLQRLQELESSGRIGQMGPQHYSIMGYILNPEVLLRETVPALIRDLKEDLADVVVLEATLQALEGIQTPGEIVHLPFEWPEAPKEVRNHPPVDPPLWVS